MSSVSAVKEETEAPTRLTTTVVDKLNNPATSSDFDVLEGVNQVLADVGCQQQTAVGNSLSMVKIPLFPAGSGLQRWQT